MDEKIKLLERRLDRERKARKQAETILEEKALELYHANMKLKSLNESLAEKAANKSRELEKSEQRYHGIIESAHDIIYRINNTGEITYMNSVVFKIMGYKSEEIIGAPFWDYVPEEFQKDVIQFYLDAISEKKEQTYFEFPVKNKQGTLVWVGQNVTLVFEDGILLEGTAMARDITERRHFHKELQKSEERYRGIIENMELGLMEVGLDGMIIKPYPRFCKMLGYEAEEMIGQNAQDLLLPDEFLPVIQQQDADRKEGKAGVYEMQIKRKNGAPIWVLISGAPIYDLDGNVYSTMGIHYDLTPQKQLQADLEKAKLVAEEAQEAEKQFLANMSHEIRTPLNAIIGMSHLLYDTRPTSEQKEYLSVLKTSADLLHRLISDILDLSKIRAGKLEAQQKEFDLGGLVKSLEKNFQLKLEGCPIEVKAFTGEGLVNLLIGDDLLLNQILLNLMGNAAKFTTEGHIHLHVNLVNVKGRNKTYEFRVSDTGIGIPKEKMDLIFQSFRQVDGDIKRKFGGTGLGLTITKQLIDLQEGTIEVKSKVDKGSDFIFRLTFEDAGRKIEPRPTKNVIFSGKKNSVKKILVVEDNYMNRKYISTLLRKWNFDFKMANNGKEGVEMAGKEKFDVILMDIQMPIMDGYEATIVIRNQKNLNQHTDIIALTASAMISQRDKAFDMGMTDYISKPFKPSTLLEKLKLIENQKIIENSEENKVLFQFNERLDRVYLGEVYEGDYEYAADMFETFLEVSLPEILSIENFVNAGDWEKVGSLGHKVKPAFSMVGLTDLNVQMDAFEKLAKNASDKTDLPAKFQIIRKELEEFLPILKEDLMKILND